MNLKHTTVLQDITLKPCLVHTHIFAPSNFPVSSYKLKFNVVRLKFVSYLC